jgi:hypothetical protein
MRSYYERMRRLLVASCVVLAFPALLHAGTNPVVAAAKRTAAAKSLTFGMKIATVVPGQGSFTMTGSGAQRGTSVKLSMRTRANGAVVRMDAVLLQERGRYVMYMRSPVFRSQLPRGKSWLRVDLSRRASSLGLDFTSLLNASQTFAPLEKGLVSTTRVGRAVVAGRSVTQYRAVIDIQRAARAVPGYGRQVAALERATGIRLGRVPYDVWVAGDGRIRRMRFSMPTVAGGRSVQTVTFLSFDAPVTITAPPPAQVVSA